MLIAANPKVEGSRYATIKKEEKKRKEIHATLKKKKRKGRAVFLSPEPRMKPIRSTLGLNPVMNVMPTLMHLEQI